MRQMYEKFIQTKHLAVNFIQKFAHKYDLQVITLIYRSFNLAKSQTMKKLLFFIILCSLFSCSTETQEEQPVVTGKNFALSLYSTDSIYQSGIDSLFLFYFPESSTPAKPIYFQQELAWGDPIVLQDLEPEPHTFITVACSGSLEELKDLHMELHRNYIRINRHDNVSENLFGGVLKADPVSGEKKFELQRLVGGVKINSPILTL